MHGCRAYASDSAVHVQRGMSQVQPRSCYGVLAMALRDRTGIQIERGSTAMAPPVCMHRQAAAVAMPNAGTCTVLHVSTLVTRKMLQQSNTLLPSAHLRAAYICSVRHGPCMLDSEATACLHKHPAGTHAPRWAKPSASTQKLQGAPGSIERPCVAWARGVTGAGLNSIDRGKLPLFPTFRAQTLLGPTGAYCTQPQACGSMSRPE